MAVACSDQRGDGCSGEERAPAPAGPSSAGRALLAPCPPRSSGQEPAVLGAGPRLPAGLQHARSAADGGVRWPPPSPKCLLTPAVGRGEEQLGQGMLGGALLALLSPQAVSGASACWHRGASGEHPGVKQRLARPRVPSELSESTPEPGHWVLRGPCTGRQLLASSCSTAHPVTGFL